MIFLPGDGLMRGKRYGQLMIFSDIAATMMPPPFAIFCIDADVLTGWKDVDAMITTMEGILLFGGTCIDFTLLELDGVQCSVPFVLKATCACAYGRLLQPIELLRVHTDNPKAGGIAGNIGITNYHMANPLICSQVSST